MRARFWQPVTSNSTVLKSSGSGTLVVMGRKAETERTLYAAALDGNHTVEIDTSKMDSIYVDAVGLTIELEPEHVPTSSA